MSSSFKPKQALTLSSADLAALQGDGSAQAIKTSLSSTPPFTSASVVHDNACGAGAVSEIILNSTPPPPSGIQIHATDISPDFVAGTKAYVASKDWPVTTAVMDMRALDFTDDFFTHNFTACKQKIASHRSYNSASIGFHCMSGVDKAAKEIHRTLKPGGTATVLIWTVMPHISVLQDAHWRTRGKDAPMPSLLPCEKQFTKDDLAKTLKSGGFVDVETRDLVIKIKMQDLEHWAQLAWSFLGTLPGPEQWLEHDEENWDEAIKIIIEGIKNHPLSVIGENGEFFMGFEGAFCVAKK